MEPNYREPIYRIDEEQLAELYGSYAIQRLIDEFRFKGVLVEVKVDYEAAIERTYDLFENIEDEQVDWLEKHAIAIVDAALTREKKDAP